jgi:hypothetical protein
VDSRKETGKEKDYFEFMQKLFDNGHAEPIPESDIASKGPWWYLPHFCVYTSKSLVKYG